jgi:hypothetical protein
MGLSVFSRLNCKNDGFSGYKAIPETQSCKNTCFEQQTYLGQLFCQLENKAKTTGKKGIESQKVKEESSIFSLSHFINQCKSR